MYSLPVTVTKILHFLSWYDFSLLRSVRRSEALKNLARAITELLDHPAMVFLSSFRKATLPETKS